MLDVPQIEWLSTSSTCAFNLSETFLLKLLGDAQGWSEVGMGLRGWGSDTRAHCTVRNLLLCGLGLCAPAACWQYRKLGRYLWVGSCPVSPCSPWQPCAPWGAAFKWVLNEQREQRVRSCTGTSGWAAGSHSTDHGQLCLWATGLLGISLLSKDCPCAALKAQAERIVS